MSTTELSVEDRVLEKIRGIVKTDEIKRNPDIELFKQHLLDSLGTVELMVALSEEFGIEISPAEIDREDWATPRKIVKYIEGRLAT